MKIDFKVRINGEEQWLTTDGSEGVWVGLKLVGSPEGIVTAPLATQCAELDANNNLVKVWVKQTVSGNTGWS